VTKDRSDAEFADLALARLPAVTPAPGFEAALLASYDSWQLRRPAGPWAGLQGALRAFSDLVWPGAPLWAPASAFAAALLLGIGLGVMLPGVGGQRMAFSLEQTPGFTLISPDPEEDL
jgi:hypothetical protein